ncbi:MAG: endonuclease/exonuclease/phosphatase family protein [Pseudomonadaceae bacterium]|nr:endonuclease/exonuclease/phosphatase family protein [Pseudomonadaceae bacterium]
MFLLLSTSVLALVLFTLLPLSRHPHWLVRGLDFPRLQLAVLAGGLLVAVLLGDLATTAKLLLLATTLACLLWQLAWILPYTRLWRCEVPRVADNHIGSRLSILTANVLMPNRNADTLIELVRKHKPSVLVTLESDDWWESKLDSLQDLLPFAVKCPLDNLYGMHVYTSLPILEQHTRFLVEKDVPSMHLRAQLDDGTCVNLHFLHPAPPSPTENPESSERDAELIVVAQSIADNPGEPTIVTGDLNDVAWSSTTRLFRKISGLLDPRIGRGMFNTFHAKIPLLRWPLDHLFHTQDFQLDSIQRLPAFGSDHYALLTRLAIANDDGRDEAQPQLDVSDADEKWADEIAQEKDVHHRAVPKPGADQSASDSRQRLH